MKKLVILTFLMLLASGNGVAQSISCNYFQEIAQDKESGDWEKWPSAWSSIEEAGIDTFKLVITESGNDYTIKFYIDGALDSTLKVTYNTERTERVRKGWEDQSLHCYLDGEGGSFFTKGLSLQTLAEDSDEWKTNPDAEIYMWVKGIGFRLKYDVAE